jgi:hypothetical protein
MIGILKVSNVAQMREEHKHTADSLVCPLSYDHFTDPFISTDRILYIVAFCFQSSYFDSRLQIWLHIVQNGGCSDSRPPSTLPDSGVFGQSLVCPLENCRLWSLWGLKSRCLKVLFSSVFPTRV